jgi:hypothetical protein
MAEDEPPKPRKNGIVITTPFGNLEGTEGTSISIILAAIVCGCIIYVGWKLQEQHAAIIHGMDQVFLATILTPDQKEHLPPIVQEMARQKTEQKARQTIQP